jgi:predicted DNA-binding WGR domain protein
MAAERSLLLEFETRLPPLPTKSCDTFGLVYHPEEKALWMLDFSGSLWRCRDEAWSLVSNAQDLMPKGYSQVYSWGFYFYWDGARKAPVCFATGYGGDELPKMGVWNGARFQQVVPKNAIKSSNRDAFAFDATRNVLVHFVSVRDDDPRFAPETLHARELDAKGVWRDVGPAQPMSDPVDMMAGYDGCLGATVCISADGVAFAWDGKAWTSVGVEARYPWFPYATAPGPGSRGMVFVYAPRETGSWPAHLLELRGGALREMPVTGLHVSGGLAHDADRDVTYVFGPWFGDGTLQHTLGEYRDGAFRPAGRVVAGQTPLAARGYLFGDEGRAGLYWLRVSGSRPMAEVLPTSPPSIGHATTCSGIHAVGHDGKVSRLEPGGTEFVDRATAPSGFPTRGSTCLGSDYEGDRLLLVSGAPSGYRPFPKDAWLLSARNWKKLPLTGTAPALAGAAVVFDARRGRWIVAGGRDKTYKEGLKTFETDEKKWKPFPTEFLNAKGKETGIKHVGLMVYDTPSQQTFCLAGLYAHDRAYVYEGEGVWRLLTDAPAIGAYDVETRTLAWRDVDGDGEVRTLDVGALLDQRSATSDQRSAPAKGRVKSIEPTAEAPIPALPRSRGKEPAHCPSPAHPDAPDQVWLRYQDDHSDKVWFARLEGASFTVRFGKRGGTLQEKTSPFKSASLAEAKYRTLVQEKLDRGYEHAPEGEAVAKLPGRRAWHIVGKERSNDVWGGVPKGVSAHEWPVCAECKAPMIHVATFHAHPERLPLEKHAALMAFVCGGEMCEFWDPEMGANKVLLRTAKQLAKATLKAPPKGAEKAKARVLSYREVFEVDCELEPNAQSPETCDKVGGYPAWIQGNAAPECRSCKKPMRFVAQLNEHDLNFTGGGIAYVFVCEEEHEGALLMQR